MLEVDKLSLPFGEPLAPAGDILFPHLQRGLSRTQFAKPRPLDVKTQLAIGAFRSAALSIDIRERLDPELLRPDEKTSLALAPF